MRRRKAQSSLGPADLQIYLMMLARQLGVDLLQAAADKMEKNAQKYPVEASRGSTEVYGALIAGW
jgi:dCTP diphosphatase